MKHVKLFEEYSDKKLSIGDNTNMGVIDDETETQFHINGMWYHKSIVTPSDNKEKEPLRNRGRISPYKVISAFANGIEQYKIEEYTKEMKYKGLIHEFPPIKGFPIIIDESDMVNYGEFLNGDEITDEDLGKYAWVTTDGHHRTLAAINANLPYLETKLDPVYLGDEKDYVE